MAQLISGWENNTCLGVGYDGKLKIFAPSGTTDFTMTGITQVMAIDSGPGDYPALIIDQESFYTMAGQNKEYAGGNIVRYYNGTSWVTPSPGQAHGAIDISNLYTSGS